MAVTMVVQTAVKWVPRTVDQWADPKEVPKVDLMDRSRVVVWVE